MRTTWLVQRLEQPPRSAFLAKATQVFGGGTLQLTPEAWKLLQNIFDIDYMGAAEFEFGSLPRSFKELAADAAKLEAFEMAIEAKLISPNRWREIEANNARRKEIAQAKAEGKPVPRKKKPKKAEKPADKTVYILCRKEHKEEVIQRIKDLAGNKIRLKERSCFDTALDPVIEHDSKYCGWYELDNGFFFFTDKAMWEKTTRLFRDGEYDDEVLEQANG